MPDDTAINQIRTSIDAMQDQVARIDEGVKTIKENYVTTSQMDLSVERAVTSHERHQHKAISWALIGQILVMIGMVAAAVMGLK